MRFDQRDHPERQPGEVWLMNADKNTPLSCAHRKGKRAFNTEGKLVEGLVPFFGPIMGHVARNLGKTSEVADGADGIVWPVPGLRDVAKWDHHLEIVCILCFVGRITRWQDGEEGKDGYVHFPYEYVVEGVEVSFLPHWAFVTIAGKSCPIPRDKPELLKFIRAARVLRCTA